MNVFILRKIAGTIMGFLILGPFILLMHLIAIFTGREKARKIIGPAVAYVGKIILKISFPSFGPDSDFNEFSFGLIKNLKIWRVFYDVHAVSHTSEMLKLHISNCPFIDVANFFGCRDLGPYICQGDWEFAKDKKDHFIFERNHQIGTGDTFCDHTYLKRKAG